MEFEENINYQSDPASTEMYFKSVEKYLNDLLNAQGYLYKKQIFESLGIKWNPLWENILYVLTDDGKLKIKDFIE